MDQLQEAQDVLHAGTVSPPVLIQNAQPVNCQLSTMAQQLQLVFDRLNALGCGPGDTVSVATEVQGAEDIQDNAMQT